MAPDDRSGPIMMALPLLVAGSFLLISLAALLPDQDNSPEREVLETELPDLDTEVLDQPALRLAPRTTAGSDLGAVPTRLTDSSMYNESHVRMHGRWAVYVNHSTNSIWYTDIFTGQAYEIDDPTSNQVSDPDIWGNVIVYAAHNSSNGMSMIKGYYIGNSPFNITSTSGTEMRCPRVSSSRVLWYMKPAVGGDAWLQTWEYQATSTVNYIDPANTNNYFHPCGYDIYQDQVFAIESNNTHSYLRGLVVGDPSPFFINVGGTDGSIRPYQNSSVSFEGDRVAHLNSYYGNEIDEQEVFVLDLTGTPTYYIISTDYGAGPQKHNPEVDSFGNVIWYENTSTSATLFQMDMENFALTRVTTDNAGYPDPSYAIHNGLIAYNNHSTGLGEVFLFTKDYKDDLAELYRYQYSGDFEAENDDTLRRRRPLWDQEYFGTNDQWVEQITDWSREGPHDIKTVYNSGYRSLAFNNSAFFNNTNTSAVLTYSFGAISSLRLHFDLYIVTTGNEFRIEFWNDTMEVVGLGIDTNQSLYIWDEDGRNYLGHTFNPSGWKKIQMEYDAPGNRMKLRVENMTMLDWTPVRPFNPGEWVRDVRFNFTQHVSGSSPCYYLDTVRTYGEYIGTSQTLRTYDLQLPAGREWGELDLSQVDAELSNFEVDIYSSDGYRLADNIVPPYQMAGVYNQSVQVRFNIFAAPDENVSAGIEWWNLTTVEAGNPRVWWTNLQPGYLSGTVTLTWDSRNVGGSELVDIFLVKPGYSYTISIDEEVGNGSFVWDTSGFSSTGGSAGWDLLIQLRSRVDEHRLGRFSIDNQDPQIFNAFIPEINSGSFSFQTVTATISDDVEIASGRVLYSICSDTMQTTCTPYRQQVEEISGTGTLPLVGAIFHQDWGMEENRYLFVYFEVTDGAGHFVDWVGYEWINATNQPYRINLLTPIAGETLTGTVNITWQPISAQGNFLMITLFDGLGRSDHLVTMLPADRGYWEFGTASYENDQGLDLTTEMNLKFYDNITFSDMGEIPQLMIDNDPPVFINATLPNLTVGTSGAYDLTVEVTDLSGVSTYTVEWVIDTEADPSNVASAWNSASGISYNVAANLLSGTMTYGGIDQGYLHTRFLASDSQSLSSELYASAPIEEPGADIAIQQVYLYDDQDTQLYGSDNLIAGNDYYFRVYVGNQGQTDVSFNLVMRIGSTELARIPGQSLNISETKTWDLHFTAGAQPGQVTYTFEAVVIGLSDVDSSDNTQSVVKDIVAAPVIDIEITDVTIYDEGSNETQSNSLFPGTEYTFTVVVHNRGLTTIVTLNFSTEGVNQIQTFNLDTGNSFSVDFTYTYDPDFSAGTVYQTTAVVEATPNIGPDNDLSDNTETLHLEVKAPVPVLFDGEVITDGKSVHFRVSYRDPSDSWPSQVNIHIEDQSFAMVPYGSTNDPATGVEYELKFEDLPAYDFDTNVDLKYGFSATNPRGQSAVSGDDTPIYPDHLKTFSMEVDDDQGLSNEETLAASGVAGGALAVGGLVALRRGKKKEEPDVEVREVRKKAPKKAKAPKAAKAPAAALPMAGPPSAAPGSSLPMAGPVPVAMPPVAKPARAPKMPVAAAEPSYSPDDEIMILPKVDYEKASIVYKITIRNTSGGALSEVRVKPFIPHDLFISDAEERTLSLIRPKDKKMVAFSLRPKGECGNVTISGKVTYYDTRQNKHVEKDLPPKETSIICPVLKLVQIPEDQWRPIMATLMRVEEATEEIPLAASQMFDMVCDVVKDLNMFMLPPKVTEASNIYRGSAQFYCEGVKALKYGAQVEIMGGARKSKMILRAFAPNDQSLVGFYHCMLDEIQKRTNVKDYISDEPTIVQHVHGDMIGSKVDLQDSVVMGSKLGGGVAGGPAPAAPMPGVVKAQKMPVAPPSVVPDVDTAMEEMMMAQSEPPLAPQPVFEPPPAPVYEPEPPPEPVYEPAPEPAPEPISEVPASTYPCPVCGGKVQTDFHQCPWCGSDV